MFSQMEIASKLFRLGLKNGCCHNTKDSSHEQPFLASLSVFFHEGFCVSSKTGFPPFSSKSVFVIGSLIIIFLVGDSKALTSESSPASEVYYDEYVSVSRNLWSLSGHEEKGEMKGEKFFEEKVERADDFIARINRQRRLEAKH
ncbi:hypothetical protein CK203_068824 [Vitis vinifera]|uniref:Uncharacterized protein n=1 Tax=Vitis vinifera TaxID=29760 RepID=A0A438EXU1_VITVI|nr:hypothetical protein CK203_068824 [Vitis vinifera]